MLCAGAHEATVYGAFCVHEQKDKIKQRSSEERWGSMHVLYWATEKLPREMICEGESLLPLLGQKW